MAIWITPDLLPLLPLGAFSFVLVLSWLPLLDGLWPLWDKRNQALHDKVANTVVIRM
jgi:uncharacterized RDD family membrane protein YckC